MDLLLSKAWLRGVMCVLALSGAVALEAGEASAQPQAEEVMVPLSEILTFWEQRLDALSKAYSMVLEQLMSYAQEHGEFDLWEEASKLRGALQNGGKLPDLTAFCSANVPEEFLQQAKKIREEANALLREYDAMLKRVYSEKLKQLMARYQEKGDFNSWEEASMLRDALERGEDVRALWTGSGEKIPEALRTLKENFSSYAGRLHEGARGRFLNLLKSE